MPTTFLPFSKASFISEKFLSVLYCSKVEFNVISTTKTLFVSILSLICNKLALEEPSHIEPVSVATYNAPSITVLLAGNAKMLGSLSLINFTLAILSRPFLYINNTKKGDNIIIALLKQKLNCTPGKGAINISFCGY